MCLTRAGIVFSTDALFALTGTVALAEMGDQAQLLAVVLAARFNDYFAVVAGTTSGVTLANGPVIWFGERVTRLVPLRVVHIVSALFFAALGVLALVIPAG